MNVDSKIQTYFPLINLISSFIVVALHNVFPIHALRDKSYELSDCRAAKEFLTQHLACFREKYTGELTQRAMSPLFFPEGVRKTCTGIGPLKPPYNSGKHRHSLQETLFD